MSRPNGTQRPAGGYGLPSGPASGIRPVPRPPLSVQSPGSSSGPPSAPSSAPLDGGLTSPPPLPSSGAMSRAERFEEEKRLIIESCFAKLDDQAHRKALQETHFE